MKLTDYDTIIFDLDFTIWHGSKPDFWAKSLVEPLDFFQQAGVYSRITDINGDFLYYNNDLTHVLKILKNLNKNIGFITRGGLDNCEFDKQPPVKCLKGLGILHYFNYCQHVLFWTSNKSSVLVPKGNTIFIDDQQYDLDDVSKIHPKVTCMNRNLFEYWSNLI